MKMITQDPLPFAPSEDHLRILIEVMSTLCLFKDLVEKAMHSLVLGELSRGGKSERELLCKALE